MKEIKKELYDYNFYATRHEKTKHVAEEVFKILDLYDLQVSSVADVGGGIGTFLSIAKEKYSLKDERLYLIEGDYVDKNLFVIDEVSFIPSDLERPISLQERVSVAISLEVAEHLSPKRADSFVEDLCQMSDTIVFSAAAKYQGGENHVNEQPLRYWIEKFKDHGYIALDIFRPRLQHDTNIPFWYRQNMVLFVKRDSDIYQNIKDKSEFLEPLDMILYEMIQSRLEIMNDFGASFLFRASYWFYRHTRRKKA